MSIKENIIEIHEDIKKYSPKPDNVKLIAVTKYSGIPEINELFASGHKIIGENKAQDMKRKKEEFDKAGIPGIEWHFIGYLQTNKIKYIIEYVNMIHSVDRIELAKEIDNRASKCGRVLDVLLEVNIAGEESKSGYQVKNLYNEIEKLKDFKNICIKGLMTMAPLTDNIEVVRKTFRELRELKDALNNEFFNGSLTELSMGMSNDYKTALEEGATIIRVGTKIFK